MPVFTNSTDAIIYSAEPYIAFSPGDTTTEVYPRGLPTGLVLKSHSPITSPWVLVDVEDDGTYLVYDYDNIAIYNASDAAASISANTDDSNAYSIATLAKEIFSNSKRLFGCLKVLSKGTGTVYVYGVK